MISRQCRVCKNKKDQLKDFSLDRGKPRRICKTCASAAQSSLYKGQGAAGRKRVLDNWNAYFDRDPVKARFTIAKAAAKQSGHIWGLSLEEFSELNSRPCNYCGGPLPTKGRGLDRLDNSRGYLMGNVTPCCTVCNTVRGAHFSPEETKVAIQAVKAFRLSRGEA